MYQAQSSNAKYIDLARAKSEAPFNIYSLLKQNVKSCNANGEGNENGQKPKIGLISKKNNFAHAAHFVVHFFAVVLHDQNVKLPEASWLHVLWRKCRPCCCSLFCHRRSFSPRWPLAFLIFSPPLQNFMLFLPQKMSPLFFLSRFISFLVELRWPVALLSLFLCLSLSLFSKFVDMTINLNLLL